jgi:peptidoglycan lytic transglycosylase
MVVEVAMARDGILVPVVATLCMGFLVDGCFGTRTLPHPVRSIPAGNSVTGVASWYGPGFYGRRTSSGLTYNEDDLSAASTLFPLGTQLRVTNLVNGRNVEVVVNDHGPYVSGRDLDVSRRAAEVLGIVKPGIARVRMDVLRTPPGGPPFGPRYFVQVGSFTDPANAERVREELGRYYDDVRIVEALSEANRYYRVRMGLFTDRMAAEQRALTVTHVGFRPEIVSE